MHALFIRSRFFLDLTTRTILYIILYNRREKEKIGIKNLGIWVWNKIKILSARLITFFFSLIQNIMSMN